jgi:hypothetical protein
VLRLVTAASVLGHRWLMFDFRDSILASSRRHPGCKRSCAFLYARRRMALFLLPSAVSRRKERPSLRSLGAIPNFFRNFEPKRGCVRAKIHYRKDEQ